MAIHMTISHQPPTAGQPAVLGPQRLPSCHVHVEYRHAVASEIVCIAGGVGVQQCQTTTLQWLQIPSLQTYQKNSWNHGSSIFRDAALGYPLNLHLRCFHPVCVLSAYVETLSQTTCAPDRRL
jgi:hypothetical protein